MPDTLDNLTLVAGRLESLRKLKKKADPASGISLAVWRGPLHVEPDPDDGVQGAPRECIHLESCRYYDEIIDLLIKEQEDSLEFWVISAKDLSAKLTLAVGKFQSLLRKE